jgi:undecaprenyl-diphosphatase
MNYQLFQDINNLAGHHSFLDRLMVFTSSKAFIIYALALLLMWVFGKEKMKYTVVFAVITTAIGLIINFILGHIYNEPRPFVTHKVHLLIKHAADASFPSDHSTFAFSIALAVLFRNRIIGFWMLLFAILVGISRVYVGNHYPFDVVGSFVVSVLASLFVYKFSSIFEPICRLIIAIYNKIPFVPKNDRGFSK